MESESQTAKFGLFIVVAFLASAYASCTELKYQIWGRTADAEIISTRKERDLDDAGRRRGLSTRKEVLSVGFEFTEEDGTRRKGYIYRDLDWQAPESGTIKIDYLPGNEYAIRPHAEPQYVAIGFFALCSLGVIGFIIKTLKEAYDH